MIESYLTNRQGRLGLFFLLNLLQDASVDHAFQMGHGRDRTLERNGFWVLTRQTLEMKTWPKWRETIEIRTWVRPLEGAFATREFEIWRVDPSAADSEPELIGESIISYVMLNATTRRPVTEIPTAARYDARTDGQGTLATSKIPPRESSELDLVAQFEVRNGDVDLNDHVNNTRYAQWILDAIPMPIHSKANLLSYAVNFVAETKLGDTIEILAAKVTDASGAMDVAREEFTAPEGHYFHGRRIRDQKIVFTALLRSN